MAKAQAHFRLEPDLLEAIKVRAEAEKVTVTDLVTRFLMQGLGLDIHTDIQNVNQEIIEESVYQRVAESISELNASWENRISERVAESISELNASWENRISERVAESISELNASWENRISERVAESISELNASWENRISERVAESISELNASWENRISERVAESISELNASWENRISERVAEKDIVSSSKLDDSQVSSNLGDEAPKKEKLESPVQLNIIESTSNPQNNLLKELSLPAIKLGGRLSIGRKTLVSRRNKLSDQEFAEMTSKEDPDGIKWAYSEERKSYVPLEPLSERQSENLKTWKEQRAKK